MITEHIFELASYRIDREPHITVNREACKPCEHRACAFQLTMGVDHPLASRIRENTS